MNWVQQLDTGGGHIIVLFLIVLGTGVAWCFGVKDADKFFEGAMSALLLAIRIGGGNSGSPPVK